jgi:hypothetical protein
VRDTDGESGGLSGICEQLHFIKGRAISAARSVGFKSTFSAAIWSLTITGKGSSRDPCQLWHCRTIVFAKNRKAILQGSVLWLGKSASGFFLHALFLRTDLLLVKMCTLSNLSKPEH